MARIASLLPSATEIVCALGLGEQLVGRSHECDHPASVRALPVLTEPQLDIAAASARIDARVKQLVRDGLSIYRVHAQRLRELAPTHVLTQDQCEVCAVSPKDLEQSLAEWTGGRPRLLSLRPTRLADVWDDLGRVASALGAPERGQALRRELALRISETAERAAPAGAPPSLALVEWIDPLMAAGHWMPELARLAGGRALFGESGQASPWLAWEALREADPDVIAVMPCGFDLARTRAEMPPLLARPGWRDLRAVRAGRVYLADGSAYFNRPGPRLVESLEILAEMLHPEHFAPLRRGTAWETL